MKIFASLILIPHLFDPSRPLFYLIPTFVRGYSSVLLIFIHIFKEVTHKHFISFIILIFLKNNFVCLKD